MCNAYSLTHGRSELVQLGLHIAGLAGLTADDTGLPVDLQPRYRISPRQQAPLLRRGSGGELRWSMGLWGFLVKGSKPGFAPTNARDDKLKSGWPWKTVSRHQRCLIPADGFFEPEKKTGDKARVPWSYYTMGNRQPFMMAGLWNAAEHPRTGEMVESFTVVTTGANTAIRVHDRMPLILDDDDHAAWLHPGDVPGELLKPWPGQRMTGWQVIDEARNAHIPDHPGMIEPLTRLI